MGGWRTTWHARTSWRLRIQRATLAIRACMLMCGRWKYGSNVRPVPGRSVRSGLGLLVLASFVAPLAAQSPPPLDKTELIRLLTNPLFAQIEIADVVRRDRKSTRLNSSHMSISYA